MARIARVIAPGYPHHITQRGNRRQQTFFSEQDYQHYCDLIADHVHLIAVPKNEIGLARAIGEAHRRYTLLINSRQNWRGHLWQERFASFPMDESHLLTAVRYIEMNPVAAGLVSHPGDYPWSSARAHLQGEDDQLIKAGPLRELAGDWASFLRLSSPQELAVLYRHERTGRPLGPAAFIDELEIELKRPLRRQKPGPKKKDV